ncbi:YbaB/EbfC family nucleoid-associated protein [Nocardia araoensis]|uniref:YbaB/EbfC family nucleoid-associated protein n=1 Tax=Nocardia araoensis TaxID=228600 RepID=UPI000306DA3E|nr:YbaB/EbfC family nucleoid-associated protein [Nocardia araoensis]
MNQPPELDTTIAEMQTRVTKIRSVLAHIRGTGTAANGTITAIIDASGHLRDLKLPRDAHRWGDKLAQLILHATAAAERDAATKVDKAMQPLLRGERVKAGIEAIRETFAQVGPPLNATTAMTEEEVQAADDAYFERLNRRG